MTCCERGPEPREMGSGIKGPYQCSCTGLGERKNNNRTFNWRKNGSNSSTKIQGTISVFNKDVWGHMCTLQHVNIVVLSDVPHECFSVCVLIDGGSWSTLVPPLPDGAFEDWTQLIT